jgi:pyridoxine kinase
MTGYFAAAEQLDVVAAMVSGLKQQRPGLQVLVDPIIGDDGALYVAPDVAAAIRDRLLPFATIATPNAFELSWLAGDAVEDEKSAVAAARKLAIPETLVTSVPDGSSIATCLVTSGETATHRAKRLTDVPHGTGDFLAGAYLSRRLTVPASQAFPQAMARLQSAIAKSAGSSSLVLS